MHKGSYRIPATAQKPKDGRRTDTQKEHPPTAWLKWDDTIIGEVQATVR